MMTQLTDAYMLHQVSMCEQYIYVNMYVYSMCYFTIDKTSDILFPLFQVCVVTSIISVRVTWVQYFLRPYIRAMISCRVEPPWKYWSHEAA